MQRLQESSAILESHVQVVFFSRHILVFSLKNFNLNLSLNQLFIQRVVTFILVILTIDDVIE